MELELPSECPCHHERKLFSPECAAVRPDSLTHGDIRTCIAQRFRPFSCVPEKEWFFYTGNKVRAWKRGQHHGGWLVTSARRGAEDSAVHLRMPKPKSESQLSACRDAKDRGTPRGQIYAEARLRPPADILDEELLVGCEPFRFKAK